ncbi:TRAM domain-containing protein [Candidatus Daviesbacteria bacterium]|nr:TRAM domain-containing protein [Candidatus Daviesbacteria bacterium]
MRVRLVLRAILALIFATLAIIFSELIPPIDSTNPFLIRATLTVLAAWIGFIVFPDVARYIRVITLTLFNFFVRRLSAEVSTQLLRLPRPSLPFGNPSPAVGSVSLVRPLILDTSAAIDGRILDIAKVGFISGLILVPSFVLTELQQVADSKDDLKRQRGRRGFEIIEDLKKVKGLKVEVWDKQHLGKTVDERLISLAKNLHGRILTCDFNLNQVASVSNLSVLNVNDLANAVKTAVLPGEKLDLKIVHIGKDPSQGVGYLEDGTMVVVTEAAERIGKTLQVEVSKIIQIPQGKMIFATQA